MARKTSESAKISQGSLRISFSTFVLVRHMIFIWGAEFAYLYDNIVKVERVGASGGSHDVSCLARDDGGRR
jgi:hypothetical protein